MAKRVAVLIRTKERQYEGLRYCLGLLLGQHIVSLFILDHEIEVPEEYLDNVDLIDEMGGGLYSNVAINVNKYKFKSVALDELAHKLKKMM